MTDEILHVKAGLANKEAMRVDELWFHCVRAVTDKEKSHYTALAEIAEFRVKKWMYTAKRQAEESGWQDQKLVEDYAQVMQHEKSIRDNVLDMKMAIKSA